MISREFPYAVVEWEQGVQPAWRDINFALQELQRRLDTVRFAEVRTRSEQHAVVVTFAEVTRDEAQAAYDAHDWEAHHDRGQAVQEYLSDGGRWAIGCGCGHSDHAACTSACESCTHPVGVQVVADTEIEADQEMGLVPR